MTNEINYNFNQKRCIRALKRIGFVNKSKRRKHLKFYPPEEISINIKPGNPQFIMVPNHRELKVQKLILKELMAMGDENLVKIFLSNL